MPNEFRTTNYFAGPVSAPNSNFGAGSVHNVDRDPAGAGAPPDAMYPGDVKLAICNRLLDDWEDLADTVGVPEAHRRRFPPGRQAAGVWKWLEQRDQLDRLHDALVAIGRDDLARLLGEPGAGGSGP